MGIEAACVDDEVVMRAVGDQVSVLHYMDFAGVADHGKAVDDDDGGAALHEAIEGDLDLLFGYAVVHGVSFVERQDWRGRSRCVGAGYPRDYRRFRRLECALRQNK